MQVVDRFSEEPVVICKINIEDMKDFAKGMGIKSVPHIQWLTKGELTLEKSGLSWQDVWVNTQTVLQKMIRKQQPEL